MKYYALSDKTDSCFDANVAKFERIRRPGACQECSTLPAGCGPPETVVVKGRPLGVPAVSFTSWLFGVIHIRVLEALGDVGLKCLRLGNMKDMSGALISEYRTFSGVECVIPRGGSDSQHWVCSLCGALVYSCSPKKAPYVTSSALAAQLPVYEFGMMELLIRADMFDRVGKNWRDLIKAREVQVKESPCDGLPAAIGLWPTKEQLIEYQPNLPPWMKR